MNANDVNDGVDKRERKHFNSDRRHERQRKSSTSQAPELPGIWFTAVSARPIYTAAAATAHTRSLGCGRGRFAAVLNPA